MSPLRGWRPQLRIAWRDAVRSRGRSLLVVVMIALPVMGVTAADVILQTQDVSGAEALDRRLGASDARISFDTEAGEVYQNFDPNDGSGWESSDRELPQRPTVDTIRDAIGGPVQGTELRVDSIRYRTDEGVGQAEGREMDLTDPLTRGMFELTGGRLPESPREAVVNGALTERGPGIGDQLEVLDGPTLDVVGTVESTGSTGFPLAVTQLDGFDLPVRDGHRVYLVEAGSVSWPEVRKLNALGATVLSRAVMEDPPPESALPPQVRRFDRVDEAVVAVAGLIVVMALLEVVLLAGPAFAVGARRQAHNLALIAASGGTPGQGRRVIMAAGLVLGAMAALLGVLLGIGVAAAALPLVQRFDDAAFGPFDVPWLHLVGVAMFGLLSALLAALVPAWLASRQDVVAVLAGRRGDPPPSARSPILGLVLLAVGVASAAYGAKAPNAGELIIAGSAVICVVGMLLLVSPVLGCCAWVARWSPLGIRYAARDAARHRTRTVPAVAAVAATVAGVVALGIGAASDAAEAEATYSPILPAGEAKLAGWTGEDYDWDELASLVHEALPAAEVSMLRGIPEQSVNGDFLDLELEAPGERRPLLLGYGTALGSSVLVSDGPLPPGLLHVSPEEESRAEDMLARGGAVVFTSIPVDADEVRISASRWSQRTQEETDLAPTTVEATFIRVGDDVTAQAVVPPSIAKQLGVPQEVVGLHVAGAVVSAAQEADIDEAVAAVAPDLSLYVERGYQHSGGAVILLVVLGALGGVLMLGGTLTATFLALSDARPDLATLSAVGASPRRRRGVAMAYALVVGFVGAVLGAAVGFVPGVAVTRPLTTTTPYGGGQVGPFLDVPWVLVGAIVVVLPLLTAAVVGLSTRSRLPMVARVD